MSGAGIVQWRFAAPVYVGGGRRHVYRHHYSGPRHFGPRHYGYAGPRYYAPRHYGPRFCRVIWTYYGPRKICRYRPWHHHHWHHRRHFNVYW